MKRRNTADQLPWDVGGKPKKRTTMIKPAAATLDVLPSSHVDVGGKKKKKKSLLVLGVEEKMMNEKKKKHRKDEESEEEEEEEEEECDLPTDIWIEILFRLPFFTLFGLSFVSRTWNHVITRWQSHHHRNTTPAALLSYPHRPPPTTKTYLRLVGLPSDDHQRQQWITLGPLENKGVLQPRSLHATTTTYLPFDHILIPEASCHGLVCFSVSTSLHRIFVGNPLLNDDFLMIPGPKTNRTIAAMVTENMRNHTGVTQYLVGFGFSPKTNSYKIMQFMRLSTIRPRRLSRVGAFQIFTICDSSGQHEESPSWRRLGSFPRQFLYQLTDRNPLGSYWKGGIHWLFYDKADDDSIFISRLDLDTEEFGRLPVPQALNFKTNDWLHLNGVCLGVSDGYLNICANLFRAECDIWVMKEHNSWTKQFVVRSPVPVVGPRPYPRVQLLNYAAAEASTREGAVSEVMLLYNKFPLFACATKGGHIREVTLPLGPVCFIAHVPSFLSIRDAAKM